MERLVREPKIMGKCTVLTVIHLGIPRTSRELVNEAGLYADRLSVNVEIPKEENLKLLCTRKRP